MPADSDSEFCVLVIPGHPVLVSAVFFDDDFPDCFILPVIILNLAQVQLVRVQISCIIG